MNSAPQKPQMTDGVSVLSIQSQGPVHILCTLCQIPDRCKTEVATTKFGGTHPRTVPAPAARPHTPRAALMSQEPPAVLNLPHCWN